MLAICWMGPVSTLSLLRQNAAYMKVLDLTFIA